MPIQSVCVFCASSNDVPRLYFDAAAHLGHCLAARGITLVYGGGNNGLMGALAQAVHKSGGHVVGVIPLALQELELAYVDADELIVTRDLRERKATMEARSDAYIALPGGYGTLEEILEAVTLRQLRFHEKPVAFLNTAGFYEPLVQFFLHMIEQGFAKAASTSLFHLAPTPEEALDYLDAYESKPGKYVPQPITVGQRQRVWNRRPRLSLTGAGSSVCLNASHPPSILPCWRESVGRRP